MPDTLDAERFPEVARLQRSFQLGFRLGAIVATVALALGVVTAEYPASNAASKTAATFEAP